jgi:hypothetical protein
MANPATGRLGDGELAARRSRLPFNVTRIRMLCFSGWAATTGAVFAVAVGL